MDEELFKKGLEKRKATLGKEYVEKNLEKADDFSLPFQKGIQKKKNGTQNFASLSTK